MGEVAAAAGPGLTVQGVQVNHLAHLAGAATGAFLIFLLSRLPEDPNTAKKLDGTVQK